MENAPEMNKELDNLRKEVMHCFREKLPAREFGATLMLALVGLHMTEADIRKTHNLEERRRLIHEFNSQKDTIQKGLYKPGKGKKPACDGSACRPERAVSGLR